jgi:hypothetical protein
MGARRESDEDPTGPAASADGWLRSCRTSCDPVTGKGRQRLLWTCGTYLYRSLMVTFRGRSSSLRSAVRFTAFGVGVRLTRLAGEG